jgi:signal transduction protein with GAF and PtsI domain
MDTVSELQSRTTRLEALLRVSRVIHSTLELRESLELILSEALQLVGASSGLVALLNPTTGFLEIEAAQGLPANVRWVRLRVGEGVAGWVARTGRPANVGHVANDPRYLPMRRNVGSG